MSANRQNLNTPAEYFFVGFEDRIARLIHWAVDLATNRRPGESSKPPAPSTGRKIDAELRREPRNPLRGWRWV